MSEYAQFTVTAAGPGYVLVNHRETDEPGIMCQACGSVSYNPHDIENLYCGRCHKFHRKGLF